MTDKDSRVLALVSGLTETQKDELQALCGTRYRVEDVSGRRDDLASMGDAVEIVYGMVRPAELAVLTGLRWVQTSWTGVENLLYPEMIASDVVVTCSRGHCSVQLAETTVAGLLYFWRGLPEFFQASQSGVWASETRARVFEGSRAMVLGVGEIGAVIARKLHALGVRVRGVNTSGRPATGCDEVCTLGQARDRLGDVDLLAVGLPASPHTRKFVDGPFLRALRPGAVVANISRGSVIDEAALLREIDSSQISGAMLDVTDPEPPPADSPLFGHPRVLLTGHRAAFPIENNETAYRIFKENLQRWLRGNHDTLAHVVDKGMGY
jgi:phosphoglycerate dehydrogenase-like enzyme